MASGTEELAAVVLVDWEVDDTAVVVVEEVVVVVDCEVVVEAVVVVVEAVVDVVEAVLDVVPSCALDGKDAALTKRNSATNTMRRRAGRRRGRPPLKKVPIDAICMYRLRTGGPLPSCQTSGRQQRNTTVIVGR